MKQKKPLNSKEILSCLSEFLVEDSPPVGVNELRKALEAQGADVTSLLSRARILLDGEILFRRSERRKKAMGERTSFLESFEQATVSVPKTIEELKILIKDLMEGSQAQPVLQWRKFEDASYEDLLLLAEDLLKLKSLEKGTGEVDGK